MSKENQVAIHWLFAFALFITPICALAKPDLYATAVPVASEDADARNHAIEQALRGVLIKLTGSRNIDNRRGITEMVATAPELVQEYRYQTDQQPDSTASGRQLWVKFDPDALDRLMNEHGWAVWYPPRPQLLVWLVTDKSGRRTLLNPDASPEIRDALRRGAEARGFPLVWPLLDLEDQARVTAADLWNGFEPPIREASRRYGDGPILVGRLQSLSGDRWRAEWTLYDRSGSQSFDGPTSTLVGAVNTGVDLASDRLAERFGPTLAVNSQATVRVQIQGIQGLSDYASVLALLGRVPGVSRLSVRAAAGDLVNFEVWLDGDENELAAGLDVDGRLHRSTNAPLGPGQNTLVYHWAP